MDTANTFSHDAVKVKFKGSKLAVGSSKMPSAVVDRVFMETLTALNKSMIEGAAAFVATKKKKKLEDVTLPRSDANHASQKRKMPTRGADVSSLGHLDNSSAANGNFHINHSINGMNVIDGEDDAHRDRTVGGLRPSQASAPAALLSSFHAVQHNRKQYMKLIDAIDPADMEVVCDYDFWLWLDAQNLFAPFSYKTHDLSVLTLQDIGGAAVRERWYQPPQAVPYPPVGASSSATSNANSNSTTTTTSSNSSSSSSSAPPLVPLKNLSAEGVAPELCDRTMNARPVGQWGALVDPHHHYHNHLQHPGPQQAELFLQGSDNNSIRSRSQGFAGHSGPHLCLHPGLEDGTRNDCRDCYWDSHGGSSASTHHPPSTSSNHAPLAHSSASTASRHETTAQGIDDPEEDIINNKNNNINTYLLHTSGDSLAVNSLITGSADEATLLGGHSLDEHILKLNEELSAEHRHVNTLLTRLRRHTLQGPLARGELEEANRAAERDKAVLARWRKANNSIHHGAGGGNGHGGIGKAKSSHKKKLGTY